jgi:hypothetical protein
MQVPNRPSWSELLPQISAGVVALGVHAEGQVGHAVGAGPHALGPLVAQGEDLGHLALALGAVSREGRQSRC